MDTKYYDILLTLESLSQSFEALLDRQGERKEPVRFAGCLMTLADMSYAFEDGDHIYHITKLGREALEAERVRRKPPVAFPTISELKPGSELDNIKPPLRPAPSKWTVLPFDKKAWESLTRTQGGQS
jgi:hypothetical protein